MGYLVIQQEAGSNDQGAQAVFTSNSNAAGTPGTDPSDSPFNDRIHSWLPYDTTLKTATVHLTVAPGSGKTANARIHQDDNGVISPIYQIVGAVSQDVSIDIEEDIPALDPSSDATIRNTIHYATVWPSTSGNATGAAFRAYEYFTVAHPELAWYVCNIAGDLASASFGGSDAYANIVGNAINAANTSQTAQQLQLPKGKLRRAFIAWRGWTNTSTVQMVLQKGTLGAGADTAIAFTMVGAGTTTPYQATIDTVNEVTVADGDYVNWRFKRTAGAATTGSILVGIGFGAGL